MSDHFTRPKIGDHGEQGTFKHYLSGFLLSLILTLTSFLIVMKQLLSGYALIFTITGLGIVQMFVQLVCFIHLGDEEMKPRWNLLAFLFMVLVVFLLVFGSLWIMFNLEERTMGDMNMDAYRSGNSELEGL